MDTGMIVMQKKVTLRDLSERLGLSQNTISLVMRGMPGISEATRKLVLRTARDMGYQVRGSSAQMPNICVMTTYANTTDTYYFSRLQGCIETCLNETGCHVITVNNMETYSPEALEQLLQANAIAGIIVIADVGRDLVSLLLELKYPILCAGFYTYDANMDSVLEDNVTGITLVMERLRDLVIESAAFIGSIYTDQGFFERWMAFSALTDFYGIRQIEECCIIDPPYEQLCSIEYLKELFAAMPELPRVFVCGNDKMAVTAMKALQCLGKRVPEEIGIVGFDHTDLSELSTPTLATVDNALQAQAERAVSRMIQRIENPQMPFERILCATHLVDGGSLPRAASDER